MASAAPRASTALRSPSVPLVVHDPYLSVWSPADRLTDSWSVHWTGKVQPLCGLIRVDGETYRLCGVSPNSVPAAELEIARVEATRTLVPFRAGAVEGVITFCSPLFLDDLDTLSKPVTTIRVDVKSRDGKAHDVSVYWDLTGEWAVNQSSEPVSASRVRLGGVEAGRMGTVSQNVLGKSGDDDRINWGHVYLMGAGSLGLVLVNESREQFVADGTISDTDVVDSGPVVHRWPGLAVMEEAKDVTEKAFDTVIAYDDILSIEYLHRRLPAYWKRNGGQFGEMLRDAWTGRNETLAKAEKYDESLRKEAADRFGDKFADICMLAYRQGIGAQKVVADLNGTPLMFSKENFSNGCIVTVDVTYPAAPLYLLKQPALVTGMLLPILEYSSLPRWKFDFAPHDLGTYPLANGQVYGGGEKTEENQMPVEECGNMLTLAAAVAQVPAEAEKIRPYWSLLKTWADYLVKHGLDPEFQLCTDDFAGHLARNANLALKAIMGIGSAAKLAEQWGDQEAASHYRKVAEEYAAKWQTLANPDGGVSVLNYENAGSWALKYNLVWDTLLGLNLFDPAFIQNEIKHYIASSNKYGVALDSRPDYTKIDWILWVAAMTKSQADFDALVNPVWDYLNETPDRIPMSDWYRVTDATHVGFQARSVVTGLFMPLLFKAA